MALVICSNCGSTAHAKALRCPKCRNILTSQDKRKPDDAPDISGICH